VVQGRRLDSPSCWSLRTLQGGRVVLGKVGACIGCWSIVTVRVGKIGRWIIILVGDGKPERWSVLPVGARNSGCWSILSIGSDKA